MKILITGGSGFLGINLIRYFLSKKLNNIVALDLVEFDYPERQHIAFIKGDIRDKEAVRRAMLGVSVVVHAAAALPLYSKKDIYSTDVEGVTCLLEEACKNQAGRFIHLSSTAVYGIPDHHPVRENDRLQGVGHYGEAKILAEKECEKFRIKGMCVSVLRAKSFIGPERLGVFAFFYEWAKDGKNFPILGSGNNRYQFLDVEDLCEAIYLCITQEKSAANDVFNIGAKEFTTLKKDFQAVLDKAGFCKKIISFPAKPAIFLLKLAELLKISPLYQWVYETAGLDSFVSIEKAETQLGFHPKYSNQDALLRNYAWYLSHSKSFEGKTGVSHRVPWKQGILKAVKIFF